MNLNFTKNIIILFWLCPLIIFCSACAEITPDYIIGEGDQLKIKFPVLIDQTIPDLNNVSYFGNSTICEEILVVDKNGEITLPVLGSMKVIDLKISNAEDLIEDALEKQLTIRSQVRIECIFSNRQYGYIWGNVNNPGKYNFRNTFTLLDLIAEAGGMVSDGSQRIIIHNSVSKKIDSLVMPEEMIKSDSTQFFMNRKLDFGCIVYVELLEENIYLGGEFKLPGAHHIDHRYVTLAKAISFGGGFTTISNKRKIRIVRKNGVVEKISLNDKNMQQIYQTPIYRGDAIYVKDNKFLTYFEVSSVLVIIQILISVLN